MTRKLDGKVALVSGSGRGIGRNIALKLASEGARLVINDLDSEPAEETIALIREMGGLDALRAFYRGIGDDSTRVDRLEPEMNRLDGDKDTIVPADSAIVACAPPLPGASQTHRRRSRT